MNLLVLGKGKTGSLVADVARDRKHHIRVVGAKDNVDGSAITADGLSDVNVVIDFTTPHCVLASIEACVKAGKNIVVGTTGWYPQIDRVRELVERQGTGLLYAANFSVGVNLFFEVARTAAAALRHEYSGQIFERHHAHKKDAPSGTAIAIQNVIREAGGKKEELRLLLSVKAKWWDYMKWSSSPQQTGFTCVTTRNLDAALPRERFWRPNGW